MSRLEIDHAVCTGHGRCYDVAPELFEPDDRGHGLVIDGIDDGAIDAKRALEAVRVCPEHAVHFDV